MAVPVVTDLSPSRGVDGGGDTVIITGTGFTGASQVLFGNANAVSFTRDSDTTIHAVSPKAQPSNLDVSVAVVGPEGRSAATANNQFVYQAVTGAWDSGHTVVLVLVVIAIGIVGRLLPDPRFGLSPGVARGTAWIATLLLFLVFMIVAGEGITDRWAGLLIDERNRMSLSRLQLVLWTVVVVSALLTIALANVALSQTNPLSIAVPGQIWTVLGISTVSLVGSPLLLSTKASPTQIAKPDEQQTTSANVEKQENVPSGGTKPEGVLLVKTLPAYARWSDLFKGEETGNGDTLDVARVQMFFFTLVLVVAYGVAIFATITGSAAGISEFPSFDQSMVALLAISHAGYLTNKVVPHSQTTSNAAA